MVLSEVRMPAKGDRSFNGRSSPRKWLISAKMVEFNHPELCNFFSGAEFK
jgi:hypothetical protein